MTFAGGGSGLLNDSLTDKSSAFVKVVTAKSNPTLPYEIGGKNVSSHISYDGFDCVRKIHKSYRITAFSEPMGRGERIFDKTYPNSQQPFSNIDPKSTLWFVMTEACGPPS